MPLSSPDKQELLTWLTQQWVKVKQLSVLGNIDYNGSTVRGLQTSPAGVLSTTQTTAVGLINASQVFGAGGGLSGVNIATLSDLGNRTHGSSGVGWEYTCPYEGFYLLLWRFSFSGGPSTDVRLECYTNGASTDGPSDLSSISATQAFNTAKVADIYGPLAAGTTLQPVVLNNGANNITAINDARFGRFSIAYWAPN